MKIKTQSLLLALKELKRVLPTSPWIPIFSCVRIQTSDVMKLSVTDGDQFSSRTIPFEGAIEDFCINFNSLFFSLAQSEETQTFTDGQFLIVKCDQKSTKIPILSPDEFPAEPDMKSAKAIGVPCADLAKGIRAVHGFEHKDRHLLENLSIVGTLKLLECLACDAMNNAVWASPLISADFAAMVPSKFCDALADSLDGKDAVLGLSHNHANASWDGGSYFCKLAEGKYPSSSVFRSDEFTFIGMLEIKPLVAELKSCLTYADPAKAPAINFEFTKKELWTGFVGRDSNLENKFAASFEPYKCTLNAKSMLKCLSSFEQSCKIYGNDRLIKMESGDLTIYSGIIRQ